MPYNTIRPAELSSLSSPEGQATIKILAEQGWLNIPRFELRHFLGEEPSPARELLEGVSVEGVRYKQGVTVTFLVLALMLTVLTALYGHLRDPVLFVAWLTMGVPFGLWLRAQPRKQVARYKADPLVGEG